MARVRVSTTVDESLLTEARRLVAGAKDAELLDEALRGLVRAHREAEIDAAYARAYTDHPIDEPDEWGDLASFRRAIGGAKP
ncbi:type II toxin-antitoxin system VapB family antitoxin [Aquihabitans daechungensis]|uniref:type II toxin-antitoxin system VapB family antitoxin n=1 Tax=Aquihabitans daechungensis TaxID=1052257 RepID=UPI003BA242CC